MELEAGSEIMKGFRDQGVKWLFLKVWGKTVKVTKPRGAKRKFTQFSLISNVFKSLTENIIFQTKAFKNCLYQCFQTQPRPVGRTGKRRLSRSMLWYRAGNALNRS
ncbi:hypothetical protein Hdeb2414_s1012g00972951 [Helianthus debilis subsp. tardiflorus]